MKELASSESCQTGFKVCQAEKGEGTACLGEAGEVHFVALVRRGCQICSILWAENFWIMSESKTGLQRMHREFREEIVNNGMGPKVESLQ